MKNRPLYDEVRSQDHECFAYLRMLTWGTARCLFVRVQTVQPVAKITREEYMRQTEKGGSITMNHFYEVRSKWKCQSTASRRIIDDSDASHSFIPTYIHVLTEASLAQGHDED